MRINSLFLAMRDLTEDGLETLPEVDESTRVLECHSRTFTIVPCHLTLLF